MPRLQAVAIVASVAGIAVSIYLTVVHYAGFAPACPVSGPINCEVVLSSPYAVIPGTSIPTSFAGIVWFAVSALLWTRPFGQFQVGWAAVGLLAVIYLVFIEIVRLGAICLWCTVAHLLVLGILLIAVTMWNRVKE
jgi:uncharacterized membrane protein